MRLVGALRWVGLVIGIGASIVAEQGSPLSLLAAAPAGVYVIIASSAPTRILDRPLIKELVGLMGVVLVMTSVILTGLTTSPYLLLSLVPATEVAVLGGLRLGITTGAFAAGLFVLAASANGVVTGATGPALLYVALPALVGYVMKLLADSEERTTHLQVEAKTLADRTKQLEIAHQLLTRLESIVSSETVSPVAVAEAALKVLETAYPGVSGRVYLAGERGPVLVSSVGEPPEEAVRTQVPLNVGGRTVGWVSLATRQGLAAEELNHLEELLKPAALAFSNLLMLETIARRAVERERTRLARELHDEIGPSLAALGLSLDAAITQGLADGPLAEQLQVLRSRVSTLVDDVRGAVADLRSGAGGSLRRHLEELRTELPASFDMEIRLDEYRPPRPSLGGHLKAMIAEAVRNAVRHSGGRKVVVEGWVDFDRGRVAVIDDGHGFEPDELPAGHYGLLGIKERARENGIEVKIESGPEGSSLEFRWG
ncbi:MAG: hypothetical protein KatS3mg011_1997 [Acidimicrobiia bacterium]|nr:MAG: hypothetical protein KatS3mg011_1997 [Acidimicrobiia bacterium]